MPSPTRANDEALWYKDGLIYQLHVKAFADSNGDGIGDLAGLICKLDYLQNLGVTAIWLLPFYPSPLRDDGYDIADYTAVNPSYGTLKDFRLLMKEAHARGLKVITELVINHTSDQHPWFQKSRRAKKGSKWRDLYVWSETPDLYTDARIIFKDFEASNWTWDPIAKAYYWHRFYSHQPDLNFDNPEVLKMVMRVMDFWLAMGVDGLRLDAIPYLIERDGTNCENLDETHDVLRKLRAHMDEKWENRMLLAEANQWPEDAVAYFGEKGDECHMAFHFPLMPRMFMALHMEDRYPIVDILEQTPAIPDGCQWATFIRNHDELTLEMVTDEERDYMYRTYAKDVRARINLGIRRRLAPLLGNNRRKIELINLLMLSLPGTPIIYYGDEIGMGDNIYLGDRNGCRTPMQWNADRNAGFSRGNPQKLYLPVNIDPEYNYEATNVELQENNVSSLLWWMRRVLAMRKRFRAFSRGTINFLQADNTRVLVFTREYEGETILVVINLSRFTQIAEIDLFEYAGLIPEEVFSHNKFPHVREHEPYTVTLGPYDHFWLLLTKEDDQTLTVSEDAGKLRNRPDATYWRSARREEFGGKILRDYLTSCRWFSGKGRRMTRTKVLDNIPMELDGAEELAQILMVEVDYSDGPRDIYALPTMLADDQAMSTVLANYPQSMIARYESNDESGVIYDATFDPRFQAALLRFIAGSKRSKARGGTMVGRPSRHLGDKHTAASLPDHSHIARAEQSNSSILYENVYFLKLYRRLQEGVNPDAELTRYLSEEAKFERVPRYAGALEYRTSSGEIISMGLLQEFTSNEGDAWTVTLAALGRYYDRVLAQRSTLPDLSSAREGGLEQLPQEMRDMLEGLYLQNISLLGTRTAEMHLALAAPTRDPEIAPEPFSQHYQRSLYQGVRESLRRTIRIVSRSLKGLPEETVPLAEQFLNLEPKIMKVYESILKRKILSVKTRIHGDYHLGQVLWTGRDYIIIDFEGEPGRTLGERRLRRSPLRDVAGMLRSFHYAAYYQLLQSRMLRPEDSGFLTGYAELWSDYAQRLFLTAYLDTAKEGAFIPNDKADLIHLLRVFVLDKAVYEVGYELNNRPTWLPIPIRGIVQLLDNPESVIES